LSKDIKKLRPFRGDFAYDLTKPNEAILYSTLKAPLPKVAESNVATIKKDKVPTNISKVQKKNSYIDSIAFGLGKTAKQKELQRVSVQKNFQEKISLNDSLQFDGYYDFALTRFDFIKKDIYSFSITPVFKYNFSKVKNYTPYLFAGIGVSYFYFHNSNASIKEPNDGIDMVLLNIMYNY